MPASKKIRILIIDDDINFRDMLRIHLSSAGYAPQVAEDAIEGGKALLANPPDLIISDLNMPYMDGFELLALLRSDESVGAIPVIFLSGRSDGDTMARAVELGASDFLTKPVTREQLLESIEACLKKGGREASKAPAHGSSSLA
jgi:DNA-binding response OmpR family regulator